MVSSPVAPSRMLWTLITLMLFADRVLSSNGNVLAKLEFSITPQPILRPGESAELLCTTQYGMLHSAEIYDARHNGTLAVSHGERPLKLAAVVPSQLVSHTCYACVARDHSGNLLAKEDLCVEVVAKDDPVIAITQLEDNVAFVLSGPSNNFNTTLAVTVPQIGVHNVSAAFILTPTSGVRVSLLELYHNVSLDTKLILADGHVSFTIHFELKPLKDILIRNITEILQWKVSLYNYTSCVQTQINVIAYSGPFSENDNENLVPNSQGDSSLNILLAVTVTVILLSIFAIIVGIAIIARNLYLVRRYRKQSELGVQPLASTIHRPSRFHGRRSSTDDHTTLTHREEEGP